MERWRAGVEGRRARAAGLGGGLGLEEGVRLGLEGLAGEGGSGGREGKTLQELGGSSRDFWDAEAVTCDFRGGWAGNGGVTFGFRGWAGGP